MDSISSGYMPISYIYANRYGGGKTLVPMSGQALYSNFANVSGLPAPGGTPAYGVDTLRILDILIGQLAGAKPAESPPLEIPANNSTSTIDGLIQSYASEMHDVMTAPSNPYSSPLALGKPGTLFSIGA
jgi:hypothetical protein